MTRTLVLVALLVTSCAAVPPAPRQLAPDAWGRADLAAGWVGHATVLLDLGGTYLLTDPAFFPRIGVTVGSVTVGPQRLAAPALPLERLPPLAAVVITHAHMDSLDLPSLRALPKDTTLIAPTDCRDLLGDLGFRDYVELGWGQRATVGGVVIEALQVDHWGKRWPWGKERGYNGYLFANGNRRVLFAPDTAFTREFRRFHDETPPLDLAIIGNGAYDPWHRNHANPEEVWQMFLDSGARRLAPVHWDTFRLGREPLGDALRRLLIAAGPEADRVVFRQIGDEWVQPERGGASAPAP